MSTLERLPASAPYQVAQTAPNQVAAGQTEQTVQTEQTDQADRTANQTVTSSAACPALPPSSPQLLPTHRLASLGLPVDLWCCHLDDLPASFVTDPAYRPILSPEEQHRLTAFRFDRDRLRFLAGRLLLRSTLSLYLGIPACDLIFTQNAFGRPQLAPQSATQLGIQPVTQVRAAQAQAAIAKISAAGTSPLRFSLSRAGSLIVLAVSCAGEVGVDIEDEQRCPSPDEVAPGVLADDELDVFRATPAHERTSVFLRYWVLKEAYAKARGLGLSLNVARIHFTPRGTDPILVRDEARSGNHEANLRERSRWQFRYACLLDRYPLAIAYQPHPPA